MQLKRQISNEEYERAYNSIDNKKIIKKATSKYKSILQEDDQESCGMQGLWDALVNHKDEMGNKFTTSLYRYVNWRCLNKVKRLNQTKQEEVSFSDFNPKHEFVYTPSRDKDSSEINSVYEIMDRYLTKEDKQIVIDHAINNMTMEEIAVKMGCSKCRIGIRYEKAKRFIKELSSGV